MPYWLQFIVFAIIAGLVQYIVSYFTEKGKNLATKEDIKDITDKVESVKASYNEALERHKLELQKEFESHKYIKELCNKIDHELLKKLIKCRKEIEDHLMQHLDDSKYDSCVSSIKPLYDYLKNYQARYQDNKNGCDIISTYEKIIHLDDGDVIQNNEYEDLLNIILNFINQFIAEFVPKL